MDAAGLQAGEQRSEQQARDSRDNQAQLRGAREVAHRAVLHARRPLRAHHVVPLRPVGAQLQRHGELRLPAAESRAAAAAAVSGQRRRRRACHTRGDGIGGQAALVRLALCCRLQGRQGAAGKVGACGRAGTCRQRCQDCVPAAGDPTCAIAHLPSIPDAAASGGRQIARLVRCTAQRDPGGLPRSPGADGRCWDWTGQAGCELQEPAWPAAPTGPRPSLPVSLLHAQFHCSSTDRSPAHLPTRRQAPWRTVETEAPPGSTSPHSMPASQRPSWDVSVALVGEGGTGERVPGIRQSPPRRQHRRRPPSARACSPPPSLASQAQASLRCCTAW